VVRRVKPAGKKPRGKKRKGNREGKKEKKKKTKGEGKEKRSGSCGTVLRADFYAKPKKKKEASGERVKNGGKRRENGKGGGHLAD